MSKAAGSIPGGTGGSGLPAGRGHALPVAQGRKLLGEIALGRAMYLEVGFDFGK
jgi:hypothetical protein